MCNYNTLKNSKAGYVIQCKACDHIQIAFGTAIVSFTREGFYQHISVVDRLYSDYSGRADDGIRRIQVPSPAPGIVMVYTLCELRDLLHLLVEGRNKLEYNELFVFNEN